MRPIQLSRCWKDGPIGELAPTWPVTPDLSTIKDLAMQYLPQSCTNVKVEYFAEGAINKLYTVSSPNVSQQYLMRVTLPVDPFFKTESEVATLAYVRMHTAIPVPNVIAYDSSSNNPLGFEWMLSERIEGITLSEAWEKMDFRSRSIFTRKMADMLLQLSGLRFREIGSLYFSKIQDRVSNEILSLRRAIIKDNSKAHESTMCITCHEATQTIETSESIQSSKGAVKFDRSVDTEFMIGPIVSPWSFIGKRVLLHADRGPFSSSCELMLAKIQLQIDRIKNLSPFPTDEYYSENDEELAVDQDEILKTCDGLRSLIPDYFSPYDTGEYTNTLYHADLSNRNILVDPKTYRITGLLDWEFVSICPPWETHEYPEFLLGFDKAEFPPSGESDIETKSLIHYENRPSKACLRTMYLEILRNSGKGLNGIPLINETAFKDEMKYKRYISFLVDIVETRWTWARRWTPHLRSKNFDYIDQHAISFDEI